MGCDTVGCDCDSTSSVSPVEERLASEKAEALAEAEALKRARQSEGDVTVNGEVISSTAIAAETQNHTAPKHAAQSVWAMATKALVVRTLLLQEAARRAISSAPNQVGHDRFETEDEAAIRALLESVIETEPVDDAAVKAEWSKDPERFRSPPLWEVSHILCACDHRDTDARMAAYRRCRTLLGALASAPENFAAIAREHSDCGSKFDGGFLGQMRPGDTLPEFEGVLKALAEGEMTTKPVRSRHGYHIVRLDAVALGRVLPLDAVKPKIAIAMEKARWAQAAAAFVDELATKADIQGVRHAQEAGSEAGFGSSEPAF